MNAPTAPHPVAEEHSDGPADGPRTLTVGVLRELGPGEHRVALTPDGVRRLRLLGCTVAVENGAGRAAGFSDFDYVTEGARIESRAAVVDDCAVLVCVNAPGTAVRGLLRRGQTVVGMLRPNVDLAARSDLAAAGVNALSVDGLPRTMSSAQSMDALTSQANVAGYKSVLVAANAYGGYFPLLMTAAGTVRPAAVLVIGAGVAGLQAISTARRLGAVVTGYDVRSAAHDDVVSTGAKFLQLQNPASADAAGGYARELSPEEMRQQQTSLAKVISTFDVVITTAQVPGRRPPILLSTEAISMMHPGSVVVDLAASPLGGNVEGSVPDSTVVSPNAVTIIGAGNLPSAMPAAASTAYSRNICALLGHLMTKGRLSLDVTDAITASVLGAPSEPAAAASTPIRAGNASVNSGIGAGS